MSHKIVRALLIFVGLLTLGRFAWSFTDFLKKREEYQQPLNIGEIVRLIPRPDGTANKGSLKAYGEYAVLHEANLTGVVKKVVGPGDGGPPPPPPPKVSDKDLQVVYIQHHAKSGGTSAFLRPTNPPPAAENGAASDKGDIYLVGDVFEVPGKKGVKVKVAEIRETEVDLALAGDEVAVVFTLHLRDYEVDSGSAITAERGGESSAPIGTVRPPPSETRTEDGRAYEIGTEDLAKLESMSEDEIYAAVQLEPARDRETGEVRGLRIGRIRKDSMFGRQGLEENDILLSINGEPAKDRKQLADYLRSQEDVKMFVLRIERFGGVREISYRVPSR
ncbi:MAG TPA: PDZ domain-containing protein [Planctomycetota bacterium]